MTPLDPVYCNQFATAAMWSRHVRVAMAEMAPQSQWPPIALSHTPSESMAYSTEVDAHPDPLRPTEQYFLRYE